MLTRTNYQEWAMVMKLSFQSLGIWEVVRNGIGEDNGNRQALSGILVIATLAVEHGRSKDMVEAWNTVKNMRIDDERLMPRL